MYWPAMYNDIIEMIVKCSICLKYRRENQREPLTPHEMPLLPWQKLRADIFEYGGSAYLIIMLYFSKYPEVCLLQGQLASVVIAISGQCLLGTCQKFWSQTTCPLTVAK